MVSHRNRYAKQPKQRLSNSVYTDAGGRITIGIVDAGFVALSSLFSVTWNIGYQYNNINMPDNCNRAMSALRMGNQVSASDCGFNRWMQRPGKTVVRVFRSLGFSWDARSIVVQLH